MILIIQQAVLLCCSVGERGGRGGLREFETRETRFHVRVAHLSGVIAVCVTER